MEMALKSRVTYVLAIAPGVPFGSSYEISGRPRGVKQGESGVARTTINKRSFQNQIDGTRRCIGSSLGNFFLPYHSCYLYVWGTWWCWLWARRRGLGCCRGWQEAVVMRRVRRSAQKLLVFWRTVTLGDKWRHFGRCIRRFQWNLQLTAQDGL
jgi:hypothetical protein